MRKPYDAELLYAKVREIRSRRERLTDKRDVARVESEYDRECFLNYVLRLVPEGAELKRHLVRRQPRGLTGHSYKARKPQTYRENGEKVHIQTLANGRVVKTIRRIVRVNGRNVVQAEVI